MSDGKILITGTGRAGTTLLVALLSDLGMDTKFKPGVRMPEGRGGLEGNIEREGAPRVVKAPSYTVRLRGVLERGNVTIDHVIIPVRDLDIAAASRVRVSKYGKNPSVHGGIWGTRSPWRQRDALAVTFYELIRTLVEFDIPHTFLDFPRFASDAEYTFHKLGFLLPEATSEDFKRVIEGRFDPASINEEPLTREEKLQVMLLTPVGYARRGWARVQRITGREPDEK